MIKEMVVNVEDIEDINRGDRKHTKLLNDGFNVLECVMIGINKWKWTYGK